MKDERLCINCKWFKHDFCQRGHWKPSIVYGKIWEKEYCNYNTMEDIRYYECSGNGFELTIFHKIKRFVCRIFTK